MIPPSSYIGIDLGDVRVGIALMRKGTSTAIPVGSFPKAKGEAESKIISLIAQEGAEKAIVGLPLSEDGSENQQCEKVKNFCRRLARRCHVEIVLVDEYATSMEARQRLASARKGRGPDRKSGIIDAVSASILLQYYLDSIADS